MFGGWVKICEVFMCAFLKLKRHKQNIVSGCPIYHYSRTTMQLKQSQDDQVCYLNFSHRFY